MFGRAPSGQAKVAQTYVHVDVGAWLDARIDPGGAHYRFDNDPGGANRLTNLCRQLGVTKVTVKETGGGSELVHQSLALAGLAVTLSDPLRGRLFKRRRDFKSLGRTLAAILLGGAMIFGVAAWYSSRVTTRVASSVKTTKKILSGASKELEDAPSKLAAAIADGIEKIVASDQQQWRRQAKAASEQPKTSGFGAKPVAVQVVTARGVEPQSHRKEGSAPLTSLGGADWRPTLGGGAQTPAQEEPDLATLLQSQAESFAFRIIFSDSRGGGTRLGYAIDANETGRARALNLDETASASPIYRGSVVFRDALLTQRAEGRPSPASEYTRAGDAQLAHGNTSAASQSYTVDLAMRKALVASNPDDKDRRQELSAGYARRDDVQIAQRDIAGALRHYRDRLAILKKLSAADPHNRGLLRDVAANSDRLGDLLLAQNQAAEALKCYRDRQATDRSLSIMEPDSPDWQWELGVSYEKIGDALLAQGSAAEATKSFREDLAILQPLFASPSRHSLQHRRDIIDVLLRLSLIEPANARLRLREAQKIARDLKIDGRLEPFDEKRTTEIEKRLKALNNIKRASPTARKQ